MEELQFAINDQLTCIICEDFFDDATTASCSHSFCKICIETWKKESSLCPICRQKIQHLTKSLSLNSLAQIARERKEKEEQAFQEIIASVDNTKITACSRDDVNDIYAPSGSNSIPSCSSSSRSSISYAVYNQSEISIDSLETVLANVASIMTNLVGGGPNSKEGFNDLKLEFKRLLKIAFLKVLGKSAPDDILDSIFVAFHDALSPSNPRSLDDLKKILANIIDSQLAINISRFENLPTEYNYDDAMQFDFYFD